MGSEFFSLPESWREAGTTISLISFFFPSHSFSTTSPPSASFASSSSSFVVLLISSTRDHSQRQFPPLQSSDNLLAIL